MSKETSIGFVDSRDVPQINWQSLRSKNTKYVNELIDTYGPDILYTMDPTGMYPIHWAVVCDKLEIIDKMIKAGVSARITARIYDEPEPIHFAALEGNRNAIDLLLSHQIDIDVKDRSGCTPLMRASMCGRNFKTKSSETVLHLISCGADLNETDVNGFNCLHFAVLHDNIDSVHLLLNLGMDPNQTTKAGKRALDLAAKSGNEYLMRLLAPLTHDITETDLKFLILKYKKKRMGEKLLELFMLLAQTIVMLSVLSMVFYGYPQYIFYYLPQTSSDIAIHTIIFILNALIWFSLYKTFRSKPGYLPLNTNQYKKALESEVEAGLRAKTSLRPKIGKSLSKDLRLCHTCRTVQTDRSTHCRFCKRCIACFDHHCIYLSTCIGQNNRYYFFCLGFSLFLSSLLATYLVVTSALTQGLLFTPYHWFNTLYCLQFTIIGFILTVCNLRRAAINLTQNEELKYRRYSHLTDSEGRFVNPFDRGSYLKNMIDYFTTKHYDYSKVNTFEC